VAMVAARTTAMAANRLIDRRVDALNPRTAGRHLPRGLLTPRALGIAAVLSAAVFLGAGGALGPLCLGLGAVARGFLIGYSYTKYFTWTSHWILGFTDGAAAAGAWIAVRGRMELPAWLLWGAVTVWIAGFDLLYACQDVDFDRRERLHAVPARFGVRAALRLARLCHVLTAAALAAVGLVLGLGVAYWIRRLAGGGRPAGLRALAGVGRRPLAPRRRLLQRERLHQRDHVRRGRGGAVVLTAPAPPPPAEKAARVRAMFAGIAPRYDLMNAL